MTAAQAQRGATVPPARGTRAASTYNGPRTPDRKPDLNGIWQVLGTAHWNLEAHSAMEGVPAGLSVVEGGSIPYQPAALAGDTPVLLTSPAIRPYVRTIIERFRGQTPVMSQNEVHPRARLKTVGTI